MFQIQKFIFMGKNSSQTMKSTLKESVNFSMRINSHNSFNNDVFIFKEICKSELQKHKITWKRFFFWRSQKLQVKQLWIHQQNISINAEITSEVWLLIWNSPLSNTQVSQTENTAKETNLYYILNRKISNWLFWREKVLKASTETL